MMAIAMANFARSRVASTNDLMLSKTVITPPDLYLGLEAMHPCSNATSVAASKTEA